MSRIQRFAPVLSIALLGLAAPAFADDNPAREQEELRLLTGAKLSIAEAVQLAEQTAGGKASEASFRSEHATGAYRVEVIAADAKVTRVMIDAQTGKVLSSEVDTDREDDDGGQE